MVGRIALLATMSALVACDSRPPGPQVHGQWKFTSKFGIPRVDGTAFPAYRDRLPPNEEKIACGTPTALREGALERMNQALDRFWRDEAKANCRLDRMEVDDGYVGGAGICKTSQLDDPAYVSFHGTYSPTAFDIPTDITIIMREANGSASRLIVTARYTAERIGDCS